MEQIVTAVVHGVSAHSSLAYATLFFAAFIEAVPVLGSFVPGSTIILSLSALIAVGDLSLAGVLTSAIGGAILGDGLAYWIGHRHPGRLRTLWPLHKYPEIVTRSEALFSRYGILAVFVARFLPPVRAFVPVIAGTSGMPPSRFFPTNIAAILCWAAAHVGPGVLAGTAYGHAGAFAGHLTMPLVAGVAAAAILVWAFRRWQRASASENG